MFLLYMVNQQAKKLIFMPKKKVVFINCIHFYHVIGKYHVIGW